MKSLFSFSLNQHPSNSTFALLGSKYVFSWDFACYNGWTPLSEMHIFGPKLSTCLCCSLPCHRWQDPAKKNPFIESLLRCYSIILWKLVAGIYFITMLKGLGYWRAQPPQGYPWADQDGNSSRAEQANSVTITLLPISEFPGLICKSGNISFRKHHAGMWHLCLILAAF